MQVNGVHDVKTKRNIAILYSSLTGR